MKARIVESCFCSVFSVVQASMEMETKLSTSIYLISMKTDTLALCVLYISWMEIKLLLFLACSS
jgi:hypothetical protein